MKIRLISMFHQNQAVSLLITVIVNCQTRVSYQVKTRTRIVMQKDCLLNLVSQSKCLLVLLKLTMCLDVCINFIQITYLFMRLSKTANFRAQA